MSTEDNKALVLRAYEALNQGNLEAFYELLASDVILHNASMTIQGLEASKQWMSMWMAAFPDAHFTLEHMMAEGDLVTVRHMYRGTHTGDFPGIPPTGKQIAATGMFIIRVLNGKFVEEWANIDDLGTMQQLGVIPPMG